jgi:hypothetical protein
MITALEIGAGLVLTAALLTVLAILAAFELGRLATRDDEQREVEAAEVPRSRDAARSAGTLGSAR